MGLVPTGGVCGRWWGPGGRRVRRFGGAAWGDLPALWPSTLGPGRGFPAGVLPVLLSEVGAGWLPGVGQGKDGLSVPRFTYRVLLCACVLADV